MEVYFHLHLPCVPNFMGDCTVVTNRGKTSALAGVVAVFINLAKLGGLYSVFLKGYVYITGVARLLKTLIATYHAISYVFY